MTHSCPPSPSSSPPKLSHTTNASLREKHDQKPNPTAHHAKRTIRTRKHKRHKLESVPEHQPMHKRSVRNKRHSNNNVKYGKPIKQEKSRPRRSKHTSANPTPTPTKKEKIGHEKEGG